MPELTRHDLEPLLADMSEWAMLGYPDEACGLVVEKDGVLSVMRCKNLQNELHAKDPARFTRTAATAYNMDPMVFYDVEDQGGVVRAIFHSHPDRGAYFSPEDTLSALGGEPDGEPILPDVAYVVISARAEGVDDWKLFHWSDAGHAFTERA